MNICMILPGHDFPPDIRVEKEALALLWAGHPVHILCDDLRSRGPVDRWEGIPIWRRRRLPIHSQFEKFNRIPGWIPLIDRGWQRFIEEFLRSHPMDALHVHDLPKSGAAMAAGRHAHLPVVLDLHENFPGSMKTYVEGMSFIRRLAGRWLIGPAQWGAYERRQVAAADRVISVVQEAAERLQEYGIPKEKIAVVENTESLSRLSACQVDGAIRDRFRDEFVILYIGGFGGKADHRGLTTAIEAMPMVCQGIPHARLVLVGKGTIRSTLEQMVKERDLQPRVSLIDWIPQDQVYSYIAASAACLVPYQSTPNTEASCPNKLFQYMFMEKPVVASSCKSLRRYVEETGGGVVFRAGDSRDLSRVLLGLKEESVRAEIGRRGKRAVLTKYNWEESAKALVELYRALSSKIPQ